MITQQTCTAAESLEASLCALEDLKSEWQELERLNTDEVESYWDYVDSWRHAWVAADALAIVAVRDRGRLVAIFPGVLREERHLGLLKLRTFLPASEGHFCPLFAPGDRRPAWAAFLRWLAAHGTRWGVARLPALNLTAAERETLASCAEKLKLDLRCRAGTIKFQIALPSDAAAHFKSLSKGVRNEFRRRERIGSETFALEYETVRDLADFDSAYTDFLRLHQARRSRAGDPGPFGSDRFVAYHREQCRRLLAAGRLRFHFVRLSKRRAAVALCHITARHHSLPLVGMDANEAELRCGPGHLLTLHTVQSAIGDGARIFDLGAGVYRYKTQLGATEFVPWDLTLTHTGSPALHLALLRLGEPIAGSARRGWAALQELRAQVVQRGAFSKETRKWFERKLLRRRE